MELKTNVVSESAKNSILTALLLPDFFRGMGGMADDHGAPEAGTRGCRETQSRLRASGAESVARQCRMRSEVSAGAA